MTPDEKMQDQRPDGAPALPDLDALQQKAEAANEGHGWKARHSGDESEVILDDGIVFGRCVVAEVASTKTDEDNHVALSQHIAANDPLTTLAWVAATRALVAEVARLKEVLGKAALNVRVMRALPQFNNAEALEVLEQDLALHAQDSRAAARRVRQGRPVEVPKPAANCRHNWGGPPSACGICADEGWRPGCDPTEYLAVSSEGRRLAEVLRDRQAIAAAMEDTVEEGGRP